jgi:hypothetical protein
VSFQGHSFSPCPQPRRIAPQRQSQIQRPLAVVGHTSAGVVHRSSGASCGVLQVGEPSLWVGPASRGPPMRAAGAGIRNLPAVSDRPTPSTHDTRSNRPSRTGRPHAGDNPPLGTAATFSHRRSYSGSATAEPRSAASGGRCSRTAEGSPRCYVPECSPSGTELQPGATRHDAEAECRDVGAGR